MTLQGAVISCGLKIELVFMVCGILTWYNVSLACILGCPVDFPLEATACDWQYQKIGKINNSHIYMVLYFLALFSGVVMSAQCLIFPSYSYLLLYKFFHISTEHYCFRQSNSLSLNCCWITSAFAGEDDPRSFVWWTKGLEN